MVYRQALQRFSYHASITDAEGEGWSSFAEALLDARAKTQFRLRETTADLIACLEMVNRHVGGQQSSASLDTAERSIDACVAYGRLGVLGCLDQPDTSFFRNDAAQTLELVRQQRHRNVERATR